MSRVFKGHWDYIHHKCQYGPFKGEIFGGLFREREGGELVCKHKLSISVRVAGEWRCVYLTGYNWTGSNDKPSDEQDSVLALEEKMIPLIEACEKETSEASDEV